MMHRIPGAIGRIGTAAALSADDVVKTGASAQLSAGYYDASSDRGSVSSGTLTLDPTLSNIQTYSNAGAHTLAPWSSKNSTMIMEMTNATGAGAVTLSGWTKQDGDVLDTTVGSVFRFYCSVVGSRSHLTAKKMA